MHDVVAKLSHYKGAVHREFIRLEYGTRGGATKPRTTGYVSPSLHIISAGPRSFDHHE
jgi:hypothetical protein